MAKIRRELEQVKRTRALHRGRRQRAPWPVIALVGYTNAGKSTLFNTMTGDGVLAEDMLFATLDPTMRNVKMPGFDKAILSDTVGFVSDLPTELIAAFRATLEEVASADLLIHVRDMAHPDHEAQAADVEDVLTSLGIDEGEGPDPARSLEQGGPASANPSARRSSPRPSAGRMSFRFPRLAGGAWTICANALPKPCSAAPQVHQIRLDASEGGRLAWLHSRGEVLDQRVDGECAGAFSPAVARQLGALSGDGIRPERASRGARALPFHRATDRKSQALARSPESASRTCD